MNLFSAMAPAGGSQGNRFLLVSYLPTATGLVVLLTLLWAGAPGPDLRLSRAGHVAAHLSVGEIVLLWIAITLISIATYPLQLRLVRLLEGNWPKFLQPVSALSRRHQDRRRRYLSGRTQVQGDPPSASEANRAGAAWTELNLRFPPATWSQLRQPWATS